MATPTIGCLLAGGNSSRMGGGQKFRRILGGAPIIEHVRQRLLPQVDGLIISARGSGLEDLGVPVVFDTRPDAGPLAGIGAALDWVAAAHGAEALLLTVPADTPFVPHDLAARLTEVRREAGVEIATAASRSGLHPTISLWPASLASALASWLERESNRSVRGFIGTLSSVTVPFDGPIDPFFNINTPDDLEQAERLLPASSSRTA
jgi:molybdopterin-guanine dinucleotide biosynthesis protein A